MPRHAIITELYSSPSHRKEEGRARQSGGKYDMPPPSPHSSYVVIVMRAISSDSPSERPFFSPEPTRRDAMPRHYNWVTLKGAISRLPLQTAPDPTTRKYMTVPAVIFASLPLSVWRRGSERTHFASEMSRSRRRRRRST